MRLREVDLGDCWADADDGHDLEYVDGDYRASVVCTNCWAEWIDPWIHQW